MSIIVHKNEPIDDSLRRLYAEAVRENIFNDVTNHRYFIKHTIERSVKKREWVKRKRRSRSAKRKRRMKGSIT
jgi:ribosomal protein S21